MEIGVIAVAVNAWNIRLLCKLLLYSSCYRSRPRHLTFRTRRDWDLLSISQDWDRDVTKLGLETETSRPRLHPCTEGWRSHLVQQLAAQCLSPCPGIQTYFSQTGVDYSHCYINSKAHSSLYSQLVTQRQMLFLLCGFCQSCTENFQSLCMWPTWT